MVRQFRVSLVTLTPKSSKRAPSSACVSIMRSNWMRLTPCRCKPSLSCTATRTGPWSIQASVRSLHQAPSSRRTARCCSTSCCTVVMSAIPWNLSTFHSFGQSASLRNSSAKVKKSSRTTCHCRRSATAQRFRYLCRRLTLLKSWSRLWWFRWSWYSHSWGSFYTGWWTTWCCGERSTKRKSSWKGKWKNCSLLLIWMSEDRES